MRDPEFFEKFKTNWTLCGPNSIFGMESFEIDESVIKRANNLRKHYSKRQQTTLAEYTNLYTDSIFARDTHRLFYKNTLLMYKKLFI